MTCMAVLSCWNDADSLQCRRLACCTIGKPCLSCTEVLSLSPSRRRGSGGGKHGQEGTASATDSGGPRSAGSPRRQPPRVARAGGEPRGGRGVGDRDRSFLRSLEDRRGVDLLRQDGARGVVEIAVPSEVVEEVTTELEANNMTATTIVDDLARIMSENASIPSTLAAGEVTFSRFMTYEEIVSYVEGLPRKYPKRVQLRVAGMSEENRPIYVVVVASAAAKADEPVIVVDGGAHAREWVSPAAALFLVGRLLESPALAEGVEWRILPLLNPDGYVYSWTHVRGQAVE
ncbi:Zinc carboxypeptidase A 1 [Penaeus vannamei]|uniref:Zinc carboxypeptidase A 1 n=1 Tax=Penaeus vannamei TaxID=6689 RepID=A0A3R7P6J1_PENVA|nr:Zinc carboxypeptidase A 1 [Penaeus vannamei]